MSDFTEQYPDAAQWVEKRLADPYTCLHCLVKDIERYFSTEAALAWKIEHNTKQRGW